MRSCAESGRSSKKAFLSLLLAGLMLLGPATPLAAQQAQDRGKRETQLAPPQTQLGGDEPAELNLAKTLPNACLVVAARPRQVLTAPSMQLLPIEVIQAAGLQEMGVDPTHIEQFIFSMSPPEYGPPEYAAYVGYSRPTPMIQGSFLEHTVRDTFRGKRYLRSQQPMMPSYFAADPQSLLAAPEETLQRVVDYEEPSGLAAKFAASSNDDDLLLMVDVAALRPLMQMGLAAGASEIPPELQPLLEIPGLVNLIRFRMNISHSGASELVLKTGSEEAANRLSELLDLAKKFAVQQWRESEEYQQLLRKMQETENPVDAAMARYMQRIQSMWEQQIIWSTDGDELVLFRAESGEHDPMVTATVVSVLVALLLPAVQAAREAARRNVSMNNMRQLMLSLHIYADQNRSFPAYANFDDQGRPLLSWRVHILPYVEQQALYEQFHLDEPWDSPHNRALIPQMPETFLDPSSRYDVSHGRTHYLASKGRGLFVDGTQKGRRLADLRDGTANTIALLQVNDDRAAIWTQPDDWEYDAAAPLKGLAPTIHPGGFMAAICDGHVEWFDETVNPEVLRTMLTIDAND